MAVELGIAATALPLLLVTTVLVLAGVAIHRSLRDEAVLEALRAEVRSVGEVHRAVHEVRTAPRGRAGHR